VGIKTVAIFLILLASSSTNKNAGPSRDELGVRAAQRLLCVAGGPVKHWSYAQTTGLHTLSSFAAWLITYLHLHSGNNQPHAGRARYRHKQVSI
jgi:hypothetical protein